MTSWKIEQDEKLPKAAGGVFIEGLPGIGNVGKIATDFLIDELDARRILSLFSYTLPHSVFVNEEDLVELPSIELYYAPKKGKRPPMLLLAGDIQPLDEVSSYEFCETLLHLLEDMHVKEIVTLGGVGLQDVPEKPAIYCTGTSIDIINRWKLDTKIKKRIYGVVGPIVGVSGVLLGLAQKRNMQAVSLLAETYSHPMYLGVKGAREVLKVLDLKLSLNIKLEQLDKEIKELETELKKADELSMVAKQAALKKLGNIDQDYIG